MSFRIVACQMNSKNDNDADPWGTVIARAPERECVVLADIDYESQDRVRAQLPALLHRRPDVYTG